MPTPTPSLQVAETLDPHMFNSGIDPLVLSYSVHSGTGVQLQALTTAAFLANATGRSLLVPPWLTRANMPKELWDPTQVVSRRCKEPYVSASKQTIHRWSEQMMCPLCHRKKLDTFSSVYELSELVRPVKFLNDQYCKHCSKIRPSTWTCPKVDMDPHLLLLAMRDKNRQRGKWPWSTTGNSTVKADCMQTLQHLKPSPQSCARVLHAINHASLLIVANDSKRSNLCVGPLNDYFFEKPYGVDSTLIGRCASSHPMASKLVRFGLPLRREVVDLIPKLFRRPCDVCIYVRLPDQRKELLTLHDALYSLDGRQLFSALAQRWKTSVRSGGVEVVSSCTSDLCREPLSHSTTSFFYNKTTDATKALMRRVGPKILAPLADVAEHRQAIDALQALGVGPENAHVLYDQLRCARCGTLRGLSAASMRNTRIHSKAGFRVSSTFYKAIVKLHNQLRERGAVTGRDMRDLIGAESMRQGKESTWKCFEDKARFGEPGEHCVEFTHK